MGITSFGWFGIYSAAFLLGIAHSLEPGHGKTVVAAYLVGSRGRNLDALILGLTVTFTHSFSIILLGVLARLSAKYFSDQQLHGYLGIVASLLILGIGLWMLKARWGALRDPNKVHHHSHLFHSHGHDGHDHHHRGHHHHHGHDGAGTHEHGHPHPHPHPPSSVNSSAGDAVENKPLGLTGLILLGISGGIVPCPAALAILLASASAGNISKGLALVIVFSAGLACSLVAIGLIIVNGVRAARRFVDTEKYAAKVAFASALIVTALGVVTFFSSLGHLGLL
ncbi:MAG TPA: sulfite exporter TauE/SafE family protein [Geobacteraceae bacterium]|nr:sulfite exporter TauE/SafE family protein [Geobacteraceae bacterium]